MNRKPTAAQSLLTIAALCFCGTPVYASGSVATTATDRLQTAATAEAAGRYHEALTDLQLALDMAQRPADIQTREKVLSDIGIVYDDLAEYAKGLDYKEQALGLDQKIGDVAGEEQDLGNIGVSYDYLDQYDKALGYYQQAYTLAAKIGNGADEEQLLTHIGVTYDDLAQYDKALDFDQRALALGADAGDAVGVEQVLGNIGIVYDELAQYSKALEFKQKALELATKIGDVAAEGHDLGNIGIVYEELGQYDKALDYDNRSLTLATKLGNPNAEQSSLGNIGIVYQDQGQYGRALAYFKKALAIDRQIGVLLGEEDNLGNIGVAYSSLGQYDQAMDFDHQSLAIATEIGDTEMRERDLDNIGIVYRHLERYDEALNFYRQALTLQRQIGDAASEAGTLYNMMLAEQSIDQPDVAVYYGKQAVNVYQAIRSNAATLDASSQKTYITSVESTYRKLADLLVDRGRLPESEQVLAMLKDQEAADYVQRDASLAPAALTISFDPAEQNGVDGAKQREDPIIAIGRQLDLLLAMKTPSESDKEQIADLQEQLDKAQTAYNDYVRDTLPTELAVAATDPKRVNLTDISPIQSQLASMGPGTVAVITLVEPDYVREIVVTSQTQKAEKSIVTQADLRQLVGLWLAALQNPHVDPRPVGEQLADKLITPIQADLDGAGATTILFSLDDVLRYVPMAALYAGKHYLVERYRVAVFTGATLAAAPDGPANWGAGAQTLLALGVTQPHQVPDPDTGKELDFPALPGVAREIDEITRTTTTPLGILQGEALEDGQFTRQNLRLGLASGYPVVHIASHFELGTKDTNSFLLMGDGTALTLDQLFGSGGRIFQKVDLLTLSACQTGEDVASSDGHQFESLAMIAEAQGAQSILASLWPVSDESTPLFMRAFYDKRANTPGMTKAEALRQAQLELIGSSDAGHAAPGSSADYSSAQRGSALVTSESGPNLQPFALDPAHPYAHPYYWAPFVLLGNWK